MHITNKQMFNFLVLALNDDYGIPSESFYTIQEIIESQGKIDKKIQDVLNSVRHQDNRAYLPENYRAE